MGDELSCGELVEVADSLVELVDGEVGDLGEFGESEWLVDVLADVEDDFLEGGEVIASFGG